MCYLAMVTSATENVVVTIKHISSGRGYIGQAQNTIYHDVMACSSVIAFLLHYLFSLRNHAGITFVHFHSGIMPGSPLFIFTQESRRDQLVHFHSGIGPGSAFTSIEEVSSTIYFCTQAIKLVLPPNLASSQAFPL